MKDAYESLSLSLVSEMSKDEVEIPSDFKFSKHFNFDDANRDERPDKFIYAYTESGISKNNRNWTSDSVRSMGQQVLDKMPVGYKGHIKPEDAGYVLPEPQIVWFGSSIEELDDKRVRLWLKGYMLPNSFDVQLWIRNKAIDSISVWGIVKQHVEDGISVIDEVDLKSIDISRKLGEGLQSKIVKLSSEMSNDNEANTQVTKENMEDDKMAEIDYQKISMEELKKARPELIKQIVEEALKEIDSKKVKEDEASEMKSIKLHLDDLSEMLGLASEMTVGESTGCATKKKKKTSDLVSEIKEKVKGNKDEVTSLKEVIGDLESIVNVKGEKNLKEKLAEMVKKEKISFNQSQIDEVKNKFKELIKDVTNSVVLEYLDDDFEEYIKADASEIDDREWSKKAIAKLISDVPLKIKKHSERLNKVKSDAKLAGEMSSIANLSSTLLTDNSTKKSIDDMTPDELAESLGY